MIHAINIGILVEAKRKPAECECLESWCQFQQSTQILGVYRCDDQTRGSITSMNISLLLAVPIWTSNLFGAAMMQRLLSTILLIMWRKWVYHFTIHFRSCKRVLHRSRMHHNRQAARAQSKNRVSSFYAVTTRWHLSRNYLEFKLRLISWTGVIIIQPTSFRVFS